MQLALALTSDPAGRPRPAWASDGIADRWWTFHCEHPDVYDWLCRFARQLVARGHAHLGMKMLWERLRYETLIAYEPGKRPRLNNDFTALYARLVADHEPDLADVFERRSRTVERAA